MTQLEAAERLQQRDRYLAGRITGLMAEAKPTYWLEKDREALALAVAALNYVHELQEYEASQNPRA